MTASGEELSELDQGCKKELHSNFCVIDINLNTSSTKAPRNKRINYTPASELFNLRD